MKQAAIFLLIVMLLSSCRAFVPLKSDAANIGQRYQTTNDSLIKDIKAALMAVNAIILDEDQNSITAELRKSKWAWENKRGKSDNKDAYVVVKKLYDIGANQVRRPKDVTTVWVIKVSPDMKSYTIRLQDAVANYPKVSERSGYTTGLFEKMLSERIQ